MIRNYYSLIKPRIITGNAITFAAGFILASHGHFQSSLFLAALLGLSLVIASACVFNNYIDRHIDGRMSRTQNRVLVKGLISPWKAIVFAICLGLFGILMLGFFTCALDVWIATLGFIIYVFLYSFMKHHSTSATLVGSIAGAVPPVVGYCAVSHQFDLAAFLLFLIVALWQMPHFFAIAMCRLEEYAAASVPVLPVQKGNHITKIHMLFYIIAFLVAASTLPLFGYTGYIYLSVSGIFGLAWLWLCLQGFKSLDDKLWARQMFRFSLVIITVLSVVISIDGL